MSLEELLHSRISQLESQVATIRLSATSQHSYQEATDVRKLKKERNELKDVIQGIETELLQIQMDTKTLAEDRDNFKLLYEQVRWIERLMVGGIIDSLLYGT